jgi:hypothetical protein
MSININVTYLLWIPLGRELFNRFLSSYLEQEAGIDHRLVVAFKGYEDEEQLTEYRTILADIRHDEICIPNSGFDIGSYRIVALNVPEPIHVFLNTGSFFMAKNWLKKLYDVYIQPGTGAISATGSHGCSVFLQKYHFPGNNSLYKKPVRFLRYLWYLRFFDPFPCRNLRTNAFMIGRDLFLDLETPVFKTKIDTTLFEHGKNSMTNQIIRKGFKTLVVDKSGKSYEPANWAQSNTFWIGNQDNLLIADNRTEQYRTANPQMRAYLTKLAWGM